MAKEVERKFLVASDGWRRQAEACKKLRQAYLKTDRSASVRVRIIDDGRAYLAVKTGTGMTRHEFEYPIPVEDAREMMLACKGHVIEKTRHIVRHAGFDWEVDVYEGRMAGLVVAEVELGSEDERPELPDWLGREVTGDRRWSNAALAESDAPPPAVPAE